MARPTSIQQSVPRLTHVLRYLWPWIREERRLIAGSIVALFAGVLVRLAEPWPLKFVLDRVIPSKHPPGMNSLPMLDALGPIQLLSLAAVAVVAITALRARFEFQNAIGFAKIGNRVLRRLRNHVYVHLQALSISFHTKAKTGDLIVRVTRDVSLLRDVTSTAILPLLASLLVLLGMAVIMLFMQWELAALAMVTVPLFLFTTTKIGRGIHQAARKQREREGQMAATAAESIAAIREVQALSMEESFAESFASRNRESQKEDLKGARLSAKLGRTVDVLLAVSTALVMWYGAYLVIKGRLTPGDLLVFLTYLRRAFKPVKDFAKNTGRLAKATAAGERVLALLEQTPEIKDSPHAEPAPPFTGDVRFEKVTFDYGSGEGVLYDVDLRIEPGRFVALTGPSGSGKSTLISLLMRFYDPRSGRVIIDGRDIRDYTIASLRSQISVVLQDTVLFTGTLAENIACGLADATPEQIETAARAANAHEFIERMPDGFATMVGERGATLSMGQRQRISIARALLRRAPILILDEPTTGLDEQNEGEVRAALGKLPRGTTTILVTHDLRLAELADVVIYLERGRVRETGSAEELMQAGGLYARLRKLQTSWRQVHDA